MDYIFDTYQNKPACTPFTINPLFQKLYDIIYEDIFIGTLVIHNGIFKIIEDIIINNELIKIRMRSIDYYNIGFKN